jgi:hypothetical protein
VHVRIDGRVCADEQQLEALVGQRVGLGDLLEPVRHDLQRSGIVLLQQGAHRIRVQPPRRLGAPTPQVSFSVMRRSMWEASGRTSTTP